MGPHTTILQDHPNTTNTPTQHSKHTSQTPYPKTQAKANHTLGSEHTKHKPNTPTHHAQSNPSTSPTLQPQNHQTPAQASKTPAQHQNPTRKHTFTTLQHNTLTKVTNTPK